jgi:hypothetical protein
MSTDDPRTRGLDVPVRPPRTTTIRPPVRKDEAAPAESDDGKRGMDPGEPLISSNDGETSSLPPTPRRQGAVHSRRRPERRGSVRGNSVMLSTSVPYRVAQDLSARAEAENVTLGEVLMAAVRHHARDLVESPPPRPRRAGGTAVRQILVGPLDADLIAGYLADAPPSARLTTSRLLRHCLERELLSADRSQAAAQ